MARRFVGKPQSRLARGGKARDLAGPRMPSCADELHFARFSAQRS